MIENVISECSLLVVATVKSIQPKMKKEINEKEESMMIEVEKIDYMVGVEDDGLKNYAITLS